MLAGIGGGIQYTEADADTSITGTAILWEDTSDTLRAVSAARFRKLKATDRTVLIVTTRSKTRLEHLLATARREELEAVYATTMPS